MSVHDIKLKESHPTGVPDPSVGDSATVRDLEPSQAERRRSADEHVRVRQEASLGRRVFRVLMQMALPIAVLALGYGGYMYLRLTGPETPKQPNQERVFSINSVVVSPANVQPDLKLYGETVSGRQIDIRALVSGRVVEASPNLREGGVINKGEQILRIDPFGYENSLQEAEAQLTEAQGRINELQASLKADQDSLEHAKGQVKLSIVDLERAKPLAKRGTVSARTVDDRQQILLQRRQAADQLTNNIKVWEARIAQQKAIAERLKATVAVAKRRLEETSLQSPFNAYVSDVSSQVGRLVGANDKIATLIDRDWIDARFTLTDQQFGRIVSAGGSLVGRKVRVQWVLGGSTFEYSAVIERVGARVVSSTGGVEVFARIEEPLKPVALRPGAFVQVFVPDKLFKSVYRLPGTALYQGDTVYVVEDERLVPHKVKIVGGVDEDLLVEGELKAGDRVMTTRISTPGGGVRVKEHPSL